MRRLGRVCLFAGIGIVAGGLAVYALDLSHLGSSSRATGARNGDSDGSFLGTPKRVKVVALGRLEPVGEVVGIGATIGDRVNRIVVKEGEFVHADQPLVYLESHAERLAQRDFVASRLAEAGERLDAERKYAQTLIEEARIAIEQLERPADLEIEAQQANVRLLEAKLASANIDLDRLVGLERKSAISAQKTDQQTLLVKRDREELNTAQLQLKRLEANREINRKLARKRLLTAKAGLAKAESAIPVDSLRKQLRLAEAQLASSVIRAPLDGEILKVSMRAGETLAGRPILEMGDTRRMCAIAEVYQSDVGLVRVGQRAVVRSPALPGPLTGKVDRIAKTVSKNDIFGIDPGADRDARVVEVIVLLDESEPASDLVRLQVDVEIDLRGTPEGGPARPEESSDPERPGAEPLTGTTAHEDAAGVAQPDRR